MDSEQGLILREQAAKIALLKSSLDFYRTRCDLLQKLQVRMRDPERTLVCDILANGCLRADPNGDRYPPATPATPHQGTVMDDVEHSLVVSFPDQSQAFTLGFEAGMLWQRMESGERSIRATTRVENRECITRMATAQGATARMIPTGVDGWDETIIDHAARPRLRVIPGGLAGPDTRSPT